MKQPQTHSLVKQPCLLLVVVVLIMALSTTLISAEITRATTSTELLETTPPNQDATMSGNSNDDDDSTTTCMSNNNDKAKSLPPDHTTQASESRTTRDESTTTTTTSKEAPISTNNSENSASSVNASSLLRETPREKTVQDKVRVLRYPEDDDDEEEFDLDGSAFGVAQVIRTPQEAAHLRSIVQLYDHHDDNPLSVYMKQFPQLCWNSDPRCIQWAVQGECDANPEYMHHECMPACQQCHTLDHEGPGSSFGQAQVVAFDDNPNDNDNNNNNNMIPPYLQQLVDRGVVTIPTAEQVLAQIHDTERYMNEIVRQDDFYIPVRDLCYNQFDRCALRATMGFCPKTMKQSKDDDDTNSNSTSNVTEGEDDEEDEEDDEFMTTYCAASCQICEQLHYDTRCAVNDPEAFPEIWAPHQGLNDMFQRILADPIYNTTIWSQPHPNDPEEDGPWIITIDNFITPEEAERLISWGTDRYELSVETAGVDPTTGDLVESHTSSYRTSKNAWCHDECAHDPLVAGVLDRMARMTGIPTTNSEQLQLLRCKYDASGERAVIEKSDCE